MEKIRHAIRLILTAALRDQEIANATSVSRNTVKRYRDMIADKGFCWDDLANLSDLDLDTKFNSVLRRAIRKRLPDFSEVHAEMQTKGATLTVLWEEYRASNPENALSYSQFTEYHRRYRQSIDRVMRQTHVPGQKAFVDFSGLRPKYVDPITGEEVFVELFVGVLGFSHLTFATGVASQKIPDWIEANNRMLAFFGGAPELLVPDNLKSAVDRPGWDPLINRTYQEFGEHNGIAIVPARSRRPQDKASVELGVQLAQRWIVFRLRKMTFFSLAELNEAIAALLPAFNERKFKRLPGSRRSRFEDHERSHLRPLPDQAYQFAEWTARLLVDNSYHVLVQGHWYSVPHCLVGQRVAARISGGVVELFHQHVRLAAHARSTVLGGHTTDLEHQPDNHRAYAERTPEKYTAWAKTVGPNVLAVVGQQFSRAVPALGLPACDVLRKLVRIHGGDEVEAAARRAVEIQSLTVKSVKSLLHSKRHRRARAMRAPSAAQPNHPNVRGSDYYRQNPET